MNYKEALFFIGKCLTINHESQNKTIVETELKSGKIDWDTVVKVSTEHYVFPALYINLKKADFLIYLPNDLVGFMEELTALNRERNEAIIQQVQSLQALLVAKGIQPIFLKGSGNLISGWYTDIAERMVGDIDFLVSKDAYEASVQILIENGYTKVHDTKHELVHFRHYPRLKHPAHIAAVEVHSELIIEDYVTEFNYDFLEPNFQTLNSFRVLGYKDQFCLSIIAKQINDKGQYYKDLALRNAYDAFLLSKKCNVINALSGFQNLKEPLHNYIAICNEVFNGINSLTIEKSSTTLKYLKNFYTLVNNEKLRRKHYNKTKKKLLWKTRINLIKKGILYKNHRIWLWNRIQEKDWQEARMIEFGLKKPRPND